MSCMSLSLSLAVQQGPDYQLVGVERLDPRSVGDFPVACPRKYVIMCRATLRPDVF